VDDSTLPEILETKTTLDGRIKDFRCRRLLIEPGRVVVLFVSERAYSVGDLPLPAGTVTFGHFWSDRPYNAYHWMSPMGRTLAHYFNLSDRTTIGAELLTWRDLAVDMLVRPGESPRLLDLDEVPPDLAPELRARIDAGAALLLREGAALALALEGDATTLWPRAFGRPRP
jgi:hypothetical protein